MRRRRKAAATAATPTLAVPASLAEVERALDAPPDGTAPALPPPANERSIEERVLAAVKTDPARAARVLASWLSEPDAPGTTAKGGKAARPSAPATARRSARATRPRSPCSRSTRRSPARSCPSSTTRSWIPVMVLVFYLPFQWTNFATAAVFGLAAITDWLDGWIARRYHLYSAFGAFLDPVADKLMVAVALFLIVQGHPTPWIAFWAAVIVGREIALSALREWMTGLGQRATVKVAAIGKIKTIAQMVALLCLLYSVSPKSRRGRCRGWVTSCSWSVTGYWPPLRS